LSFSGGVSVKKSQHLPFILASFFLWLPKMAWPRSSVRSHLSLILHSHFSRLCTLCITNVVAQFEHLVKTFQITQRKSFKQGAAVLESTPVHCSPLSQEYGGKSESSRRPIAAFTSTGSLASDSGPVLYHLGS
jgi:hypothetical protein